MAAPPSPLRFLQLFVLVAVTMELAARSDAASMDVIGDWTPQGVVLTAAPAAQQNPSIVDDGAGGAFVVWQDYRNGPADIFGTRVGPNGEVMPGWAVNGIPICAATGDQTEPKLAPDGQGGVFVAWIDGRGGSPLLAVGRLNGDGTEAAGWPNAIAISTGGAQTDFDCLSDGAGGLLLLWRDVRSYPNTNLDSRQIWALRIGPLGAPAAGWPAGGVRVSSDPAPSLEEEDVAYPQIATDGRHGMYVAWHTSITCVLDCGGGFSYYTSTAGRVDADGAVQLPVVLRESDVRIAGDLRDGVLVFHGWTGSPAQVVATRYDSSWVAVWTQVLTPGGISSPNDRRSLFATHNAAGGALAAWADPRGSGGSVYAQQTTMDGSIAPGWSAAGVLVSDGPSVQTAPWLVPSGGGALVSWMDERSNSWDVYALRLDDQGRVVPGWTVNGDPVCTAPGMHLYPEMVPDGAGGAIITWTDTRNGPYDLYGQRVLADISVAVLGSMISAQVIEGVPTIEWLTAPGASCTIERNEGAGWADLQTQTSGADGEVRLRDATVMPGSHDGYRVRLSSGQVFGETWISAPVAALSLEGPLENPAPGRVDVGFGLVGGSPARLELLDVTGRQLVEEEVGFLGLGRHVVTLASSLPAGIYYIRLVCGHSIMTRAAAVLR